MPTKCFLIAPSDQVEVGLRRFAHSSACPGGEFSFHNAMAIIGRRATAAAADPEDGEVHGDNFPHDDPRWPASCGCGYRFLPGDEWQHRPDRLWRRADTGELVTLRGAPTGAVWVATWMAGNPEYCGPDGRSVVVRLRGGHDWFVDGRAKNCDSPCSKCGAPYHAHAGGLCRPLAPGEKFDRDRHYYADARPHKCWVRHGEPPDLHVDKSGPTCGAGAGSIAIPGYHGFLHNGHLTDG